MTTMQIGIYDHTSGENTIRNMTAKEQTERNLEIEICSAAKENEKLQAEELRQIKIAAYERLGLTEAEIEALLPTPKPDSILKNQNV